MKSKSYRPQQKYARRPNAKKIASFSTALVIFVFTIVTSPTIFAVIDTGDGDPGSLYADNKKQLEQLIERLTKTKALGLFAKMSLKGDLDRFFVEATNYHNGKSKPTIEQLEEHYHLLVSKLVASIQKKDAQLAKDIAAFRDALWIVVADEEAFAGL